MREPNHGSTSPPFMSRRHGVVFPPVPRSIPSQKRRLRLRGGATISLSTRIGPTAIALRTRSCHPPWRRGAMARAFESVGVEEIPSSRSAWRAQWRWPATQDADYARAKAVSPQGWSCAGDLIRRSNTLLVRAESDSDSSTVLSRPRCGIRPPCVLRALERLAVFHTRTTRSAVWCNSELHRNSP